MTNYINRPVGGGIVRLTGRIRNYRCTLATASFVFTGTDQQKMGVVAIAATLVGMGPQAASVAGYASDMEELAEYVEFYLDDLPVKGWVWRSPFKEGDLVEVAADWLGDHYEAYGILRPEDRMIALYPHCSRAKRQHLRKVIKWWALWNVAWYGATIAMIVMMGGARVLSHESFFWVNGPLALFWVLMFISISNRFMPFANLAEKVFRILGLPNPRDIDLVESSRQQRTPIDDAEYGTFYFRY